MTKVDQAEPGVSPELAAIRTLQDSIQQRQRFIAELRSAVRQQEDSIQRHQASRPDMAELQRQRQYILSAIALGTAAADQLKKVDAQIVKATAAAATIDADVDQAKDTIAGFMQRIEHATAELTTIESQRARHLGAVLVSEAEREGEQYLSLARALSDSYARIFALGRLHVAAGGPIQQFIPEGGELFIPRFFCLESHKGHGNFNAPHALFDNRFLTPSPAAGWLAQEKTRLRSMGVEID